MAADLAEDDVFSYRILHVAVTGFENGEHRALAGGVDEIPPAQLTQPDGGVGLRIEIAEEDPLAKFGETGGGIDDEGSLTNASLVVNKSELLCRSVQGPYNLPSAGRGEYSGKDGPEVISQRFRIGRARATG